MADRAYLYNFYKNIPFENTPSDKEYRRYWFKILTIRKYHLLSIFPDLEFLKDGLLSEDEFDKFCVLKSWIEEDSEELKEIDMLLEKITKIDGKPTEKELQEINKSIREFEDD